MAVSYPTKQQEIANYCEWRKAWKRKRAQYLLAGDDHGVRRATSYIERLTQTIRELQQPPYMHRRKS